MSLSIVIKNGDIVQCKDCWKFITNQFLKNKLCTYLETRKFESDNRCRSSDPSKNQERMTILDLLNFPVTKVVKKKGECKVCRIFRHSSLYHSSFVHTVTAMDQLSIELGLCQADSENMGSLK